MAELNIVEKVIALEGVELLNGLTPQQLARIAAIAREVKYPPGKVIFEPAKPMDALYIVIDGAVELSRDGQTLVVAGPNQVLGAWALFDEDPMPLTARGMEDSRLLRIGRDDFYDVLADNIEITAAMFSTLVKRFRKLVEEAPAAETGRAGGEA
ncbi:MAG: cyclic nucleotide-binding domain-containing protein [Bryobacterales bacterium]|nr:cyclic nucleotide-binding domain-containing protein [Bryobacterales bacterium]